MVQSLKLSSTGFKLFPPLAGCVTFGKYRTSLVLSSSFIKWDIEACFTGSLGGQSAPLCEAQNRQLMNFHSPSSLLRLAPAPAGFIFPDPPVFSTGGFNVF